MSKQLGQYLAENEAVHEFRVKIAKEPTDAQLDAMELHLRKYDGYDITTPKKTIMQKNPRDFRSIDAAEVYMIDFKTRQPASPLQLLAELTQQMGIHERFLIVRNKMEPLHIDDETEETPETKYKPRLTDEKYSDAAKVKATDYHGDKFNADFIKGLKKERHEHNTKVKVKK
jgi:hypothetical protein